VKRTAVFIFITVVLLVLLLSGCGPSPSPTPTSTSTPSPTATLPSGQEPIEVVSVTGPLPSSYEDGKPVYNPGGPIVEITLKNVSDEPVIFLEASLDLNISHPQNLYIFTFDVTLASPLRPGESISTRSTLIGGGFADTIPYPVTISGTLESNVAFIYTKSIFITIPAD
jgi:hypothetical protein